MSESLKKKTIKGVIWSSFERFSTAGVNFIIGLIIARLLSPKEYGIIAMLAIFMAISQSIIDSGFSNALVRKLDRSESDYATSFYFNVIIGFIMYGVLFFSAPLIAQFYNTPELETVTKIVGITLILGSFTIVQQAILTIKVDFKTQMKISLVSAILSGLIGIIMAFNNYGVWALVGQIVSVAFFRTVLLWVIVKWIPKSGFSKQSFRNLFGYGSKLLLAGILETIYRNLYTIIIGKFFQSSALGLYSRGEQIASYPSSNITGVIQRVTFPILSQIQNDKTQLKNAFTQIIRTTCFIVFPLMMFLIIVAKPLVLIILTEKWVGCVEIIQILSISFMWYPVHILNLNVLQIAGRSDLFLKIEFIKKIIGLVILFATIPFGIILMCWGRVMYCFIELFINMYYTNRIIGSTYFQQLRQQIPMFLSALIMGGLSLWIISYIQNNWLKIIIALILCSCFWLTIIKKYEKITFKQIFK